MGEPRCACFALLALLAACGREGFVPDADAHDRSDAGRANAAANVAFVTSTTQLPTTFGGDLAGADAVCTARATAAGLAGTFVAFLSTSTINARDRLVGARGWVRTDGQPFLDLPDDIASGQIFVPLEVDELGGQVGFDVVVTGSTGAGSADTSNECTDYSQATADIDYGLTTSTSQEWASIATLGCTTAARVYCFETDKNVALTLPAPAGRRAFVTAESFMPDASGLATADALCTSEAQAASLSGSFAALLPTSTATAISRFSVSGANWVRLDGIALASSPLAFASGALDAPLNVTPAGVYVANEPVTTGALTVGTIGNGSGSTCGDWTSASDTLVYGVANDVNNFFSNGTGSPSSCNGSPIYCLEQ